MADRVLISCQHVWGLIERYDDVLAAHDVVYDIPTIPGQQLEEPELLPIIARYDGIVAGDDILNRTVLGRADRLRVISKWGVGVDAIDREAAAERGIVVYNTPGVFADELGDYALGYLLLLARRQHEVDRVVRSGTWYKPRGESLAGKVLGIVGLGSSGRALARRAAVMGMTLLGFDPIAPPDDFVTDTGVELVSIDEIWARADVVSLHLPATAQTRHIVDATSLAAMKAGVWLINISRGALVDEEALVAALSSGHVAAAALDVFDQEPLARDHPLRAFDQVIFGAHNGSNTRQAIERTTDIAIRNLLDGLDARR